MLSASSISAKKGKNKKVISFTRKKMMYTDLHTKVSRFSFLNPCQLGAAFFSDVTLLIFSLHLFP